MSIRAVIFDRDNTLVRFDDTAIAALEARIAALAPGLPPRATVAHWLSWPGPWPRTPDDEPAFWRAFWAGLAREHRLAAGAAEALHAIGGFYHTCFAAFPDTRGCLQTLRARGYRLAILTNFELPSIHVTLRHAGIEPDWFDALLSSAALGCYKPDPGAYAATADALGLPPDACAFVDDLPENVAAARALGMRAWLLDRRGAPNASSDTIASLAALPDLLAAC
jgi:putative hydrolase of the HAD superfamily